MLDVIQISYHEPYADTNFKILKQFFPHARQVKGIKGIFEAHKAAAEISDTQNFYVVDADAIIHEEFNFSFRPQNKEQYPGKMETECIYVWRSHNPVNDLIYGYGAVKLFPRKSILDADHWSVDMTTTLNCPFVPKFKISNITAFNTDEFNAWRSAFRECTKLASSIIPNSDNLDNEYRLNIWCSKGEDRSFGKETISGAIQGKKFGNDNKDDIKTLTLINDFDWLKDRFDENS